MNKPEDIIAKYGFYSAPVHGTSMYPLLIDHKDSVYITFPTKLKKYDVVLFRRAAKEKMSDSDWEKYKPTCTAQNS